MSKLVGAACKKNKIPSRVKDKSSKLIFDNKRSYNVKVTNSNVFEMKNSLIEERDEKLEIFHQRGMKKTSLPSLSNLLSSNNTDSGMLSILNNSIEKPQQQRKIHKYLQNDDIFIKKIANSEFTYNKQFDNKCTSPLDGNDKKSHDYSISHMFSDGLSDTENSREEFTYVSSSDDSQNNLLPSARKAEDFLTGGNKCKKEKTAQTNSEKKKHMNLCAEILIEESDPLNQANFERKKRHKEPVNISCKIDNSILVNDKLETFPRETVDNSSKTFLLSGEKDLGIASLRHHSIDESRQSVKGNCNKNGERYIISKENNPTSLSLHEIHHKSKSRLASKLFDLENSTHKMIDDVDLQESAPRFIDLILTESNLDYTPESEDVINRPNEMINRSAIWNMAENNLMGNRPQTDLVAWNKSGLYKGNRMNDDKKENLQLSGIMQDTFEFITNNPILESEELNNNSQNSCQLFHSPLIELLNIGSQDSGQSQISSTPHVPKFELSQNYALSSEKNGLIHQKHRESIFDISQSMYVKQRSLCFKRTKAKNEMILCFKLSDSIAKEIQKSTVDDRLTIAPKHNYMPIYKHNGGDKENNKQTLYLQKQCTLNKEFGKEFANSNAEIRDSFDSTKRCSKRRYPYDESSGFLNIEMYDTRKIYKKDEQKAEIVGATQNTCPENQNMPIDLSFCTSLIVTNTSNANTINHSQSKIVRVSHQDEDKLRLSHLQHSHEDFRKESTDSNIKKLISSNFADKFSKQHYPSDRNREFLNIEMNDFHKTYVENQQAVASPSMVRNTFTGNYCIPIDQLSSSSFNTSDVSDGNAIKHTIPNEYRRTSHQIQSFVKEWLNRQDEINYEITERYAERKKPSLKRRQLDTDIKDREKRVDIDPGMLLSNYSCEHDRTCMIEYFKPKCN